MFEQLATVQRFRNQKSRFFAIIVNIFIAFLLVFEFDFKVGYLRHV